MFEWYWVFLFYLFIIHLRTMVITIYVHRCITHESILLSPTAEHFFKFLAWITRLYFKNYKQMYKAQHSKHHAHSDTELDPHSPQYYTIKQLLDIYHNEAGRPYYVSPADIEKYASHIVTEETWIDKNVYLPYQNQGLWIWYAIICILYGPIALLISLLLLPYLVTELYLLVSNYGYHKLGYTVKEGNKNGNTAKNLLPIGILFAGEELHSNHHYNPSSPKFSRRWFEFDLGWCYIKVLEKMRLVYIKKN